MFALVFPQPFRLLALLAGALLGSAGALHCHAVHAPAPGPLHRPLYYAGLSLGTSTLLGLLLVHLLRRLLQLPAADPAPLLPLLAGLPAILSLLVPSPLAPFAARFRAPHRKLHAALARILRLSRAPAHPTRFPDIIIADLLTSLARPIADLALLLALLLRLRPPAQAALAILVNALPYLLRLKQCLNDLAVSPANKRRSALNALKYASAIPMVAVQQTRRLGGPGAGPSTAVWLATCLLNSAYSTYWDVANDWGFSLPQIVALFPHHPSQQQPHRKTELEGPAGPAPTSTRILFPAPERNSVYLALIASNAVLRHLWLLALLTPSSGPRSGFAIQAAEVLRRALWLLLRLEWADLSAPSATLPAGYALLELPPHHPDDSDDEQDEHDQQQPALIARADIPLLADSKSPPHSHPARPYTVLEIDERIEPPGLSVTPHSTNSSFFHRPPPTTSLPNPTPLEPS
ncbi:hypothetical protein PtB15_4B548 [Puccinia triticina]|nr:hypothetical protein PtB15_4B548 [Puccinia triticina]